MDQILTPCIIQTIIICCTIVILASIVVSAYRINKKVEQSWGNYVFIASIVLVLGIAGFSYAFYGNRNVLDFISLSSALISIILAIVTIVYSFYSNSRSSGQIDILNKAAQDVQNATTSYSDSAESLQENIRLILKKIGQVEQKIDTKNDRLNKNNANTSEVISSNNEEFIKNIVNGYIQAGSFFGNLALLACVYVYEKNRNLNMKDLDFIVDNSGLSLSSYMVGYIISASALGVMTVRVENSQIKIQNIDSNLNLKDNLISMINSYIERSPNPEAKQYNNDIYSRFNSIFNPESITE